MIDVVDVKVIELCFGNAKGAIEIASKVLEEHPTAVYAVLTHSVNNTSVLHIHVRRERLADLLDQPHIKGSDGTMLVTAPLTV